MTVTQLPCFLDPHLAPNITLLLLQLHLCSELTLQAQTHHPFKSFTMSKLPREEKLPLVTRKNGEIPR